MEQKCNQMLPKKPTHFHCELCDFKCSYKRDYERHLETKKHKSVTNCNPNVTQINVQKYYCKKCDRNFNNHVSLWRHRKTCIEVSDKEIIDKLLLQNSELQNIILNIAKDKSISNTTNSHNNINNNINNNNKHFNLNFYLNETCKDALNIDDFVKSIKITLEDLERTGEKGYVEGISNIIIKNLNDLDDHLRPLHCSDAKREVIYIKNNNEWVKESQDKPLLTNAIKSVAHKNMTLIKEWTNKYPDCTKPYSNKNDTYLRIVSESMNGFTDDESLRNIKKIISIVSKEVIINKL